MNTTPFTPTLGRPFAIENLEPLRDRLLVLPLRVSSRSASGLLHLAENTHQREKPQHGIVISIGPGRVSESGVLQRTQTAVGDCVFYGKYSGQEVTIGGDAVLNMAEIEVYARLPQGTFSVHKHEKTSDWHLEGDYCDICNPEVKVADERAAVEEVTKAVNVEDQDGHRAFIEEERQRLRAGRQQGAPSGEPVADELPQ